MEELLVATEGNIAEMRNYWRWCRWMAVSAAVLAGCASKPGAGGGGSGSDLGVMAREDSPADVAAVRSFYVEPNTQLAMRSNFVAGASLAQVFADRIASGLVARGLTQASSDMADATVTYSVQAPGRTPAVGSGDTQSLGYADQLLSDANALQTKDNFLDSGQVDLRINVVSGKRHRAIWRGSVAGVLPADQGTRGRLEDVLDGVDRLMEKYPKVK